MGGDAIKNLRREHPDLAAALDKSGWTMELGGSGHVKIRSDQGRLITTMASTPGDWRAQNNLESTLKRNGLDMTPTIRTYVAPKEKTLGIDQTSIARLVPDDLEKFGELMTYADIQQALDLDRAQVSDAARAGLLGPSRREGANKPLMFTTRAVAEFRAMDYRQLYPKRRTYTKRGKNVGPKTSDLEARSGIHQPVAPMAGWQPVAGPGRNVTLATPQLAEIIRVAVLAALREYHRDR